MSHRAQSLSKSSVEIFRSTDRVVTTKQADVTILFDLRKERYYTLNPVSGFIWTLLVKGATFDSVIQSVRTEFDAPEDEVVEDAKEFMESLLSANLIRRHG